MGTADISSCLTKIKLQVIQKYDRASVSSLAQEHCQPIRQIFFTVTAIFAPACTTLKFSILFFYHRIFIVRKFHIWCIVVGVVTLAWMLASSLSSILACQPLAYYWDRSIPGGHCANVITLGYIITLPLDILTNIALLVMPMPLLWKLQMEFWKKVAVTGVFLLGSL